ncbi:AAA family ATPase [Actinobacillus sp. GY-402]|nr:AAA family ATPase [Actinobacillus sp. GY-402]
MIVGLFIRNFKTYQGIHFIPVSSMHNFNGFLGDNGIGKSSILEALDCFFNNRKWNFNNSTKKSGVASSKPYIVPVFALKKDEVRKENEELSPVISNIDAKFRNLKESDINIGSADRTIKDTFISFHTIINKNFNDEYYLFPIGIDFNLEPNLSILESIFKINTNDLKKVLNYIKGKIDYVYIPKDIDSELFTRLETEQIQVLMGESLNNILNDRVTEGSVDTINAKLNEFITQLESELPGYAYRTSTDRQQNIRRSNINDLIIKAFFNIRKLNKKRGDHYIEISSLSSGEKQRAIIDVAHSLLKNHRKDGKNLIIAIDEPESSLHISACFEQFNSLFEICNDCRQVLFSSHWYGFLPILNKANICVISKEPSKYTHLFDLMDLTNYREQIVGKIRASQGKQPYHIKLKSITDLSQSIITSIMSDNPYNWLICEGTSEKIYFEKYFEDEVKNNNLRIIPVGGAKKIKELYRNLITPYEDIKENIGKKDNPEWGRILLISDTDSEFINYDAIEDNNFRCRRIVNSNNDTKLVSISANPKSPETEIEDCLNGKLFINTLLTFTNNYPTLEKITKDIDINESQVSFYGLDLRPSEKDILKEFLDDNNGENKILFALKYVELMKESSYSIPNWIQEIKIWFKRDNE